jgi:hypothetical protein
MRRTAEAVVDRATTFAVETFEVETVISVS